MTAVVEPAPAKLNLDLYVTGRRADGYHLLDSVVAFTDFGDILEVRRSGATRVDLAGPYAGALEAAGENLVARALAAVADLVGPHGGFAARLEKHIPIAAGLGGGSADAAAALRAAARLVDIASDDPRLASIAEGLGADVPACLRARPLRMTGIGDILEPAPPLPELAVLLVNPGVPAPTGAVYRALDAATFAPAPPRPADEASLPGWLVAGGNALEPAARRVAPAIGEVLDALTATGAPLVRLCGSGATCFAGFARADAAVAAAREVSRKHPDWWVRTTRTR